MNQPLFIHAATAISPQQSFDREQFLKPMISSGNRRLYALEAPYAQYISPVAIRRMSRIMKMTISAAMQCLKEAAITTPDAIITGTGRGGVTDMETFVKDLIRLDEEALNPTAFIQSTYNSPNGWIAMQSACTAYNQTYVHRGCSFELAMLDAQMLLAEASTPQFLLVGSYDELTEEYFTIRGKRGYWKASDIDSAGLLQLPPGQGTISGEGANFFVVSNVPGEAGTPRLEAISIVHNASGASLCDSMCEILRESKVLITDISLVIIGKNGDERQSRVYEEVLQMLPETVPVAGFKHLCGEYDTASGFALWLANYIFNSEADLNGMLLRGNNNSSQKLDTILLINNFILGSASIMLLRRTI